MFEHIRKIDIEIHSYCNRRCPWCPNNTFIRDGEDIEMTDEMYSKIIDELCENHFGFQKDPYTTPLTRKESHSVFGFLGNQEVFTSPQLFKRRVKEAYDKFPTNVRLIANSNGDFLSIENLDELMLTTLDIMDYDCKGMEYWCDKLTQLGIMVIERDINNDIIIGAHRYVGNVKVRCNWPKHWSLEDKGGFFEVGDLSNMNWKNNHEKRNMVCFDPSVNLTINYNGDVMPCCHIRTDNPNHKDFIMGNINDKSLKEIYMNPKYIEFRKKLLGNSANYPIPCQYCQKTRPENYYSNNLVQELLTKMP